MPKDFVYFDLETIRSANDVGGWDHKDRMGMSVGVTYSTLTGTYAAYGEWEASDLIAQLARADLVVGFNHVNFDYAVLQHYSMWDVADQMRSFDILTDLEKRLGHRIKLEDVALPSLGTGKTGHGIDAILWWREKRYRDVAAYCCFDVKVTRFVHEFGIKNGFVRYLDRFGRQMQVDVDWTGWEDP
ncbi:MAG: helicase [Verrucomicrobiales bacterium]|nr:helicase [Verrucomicrobiales bacterium]